MNKISLKADIIKQLPGVFVLKEVKDKSYFIDGNDVLAKMIGYKNMEAIIGKSEEDAKCDEIVNNCEVFYRHDAEVMTGKTIQTLDIYPYVTQDVMGILAIKKPFLDHNQKICGVLAAGIPLRKKDLNFLFSHLCEVTPHEKKYNKYFNGTFEIKKNIDKFSLSRKELECLFYLMRGKSGKEIAVIMRRSVRTIEKHIENLKKKCNIATKSEFFDFACTYGLLNVLPYNLVAETISLGAIP